MSLHHGETSPDDSAPIKREETPRIFLRHGIYDAEDLGNGVGGCEKLLGLDIGLKWLR